jgi:hypothetical protein
MQSMSLEKKQLGEHGIRYVAEQLANAAPFSEALIGLLDSGYAWEFVTDEQLQPPLEANFHVGGSGSELVINQYVKFLAELLREDVSTVLLFENQLFKLTDPVMLGKTGLFEWMGATYSLLQAGGTPIAEPVVANHLRGMSRYPSVVLATRISSPLRIEEARPLNPEEASDFKAGINHILVGAYDEEGYVAWSRGR